MPPFRDRQMITTRRTVEGTAAVPQGRVRAAAQILRPSSRSRAGSTRSAGGPLVQLPFRRGFTSHGHHVRQYTGRRALIANLAPFARKRVRQMDSRWLRNHGGTQLRHSRDETLSRERNKRRRETYPSRYNRRSKSRFRRNGLSA